MKTDLWTEMVHSILSNSVLTLLVSYGYMGGIPVSSLLMHLNTYLTVFM